MIELRTGHVDGLEGVEIRSAFLGESYLFSWIFEGIGGASFFYPWDALRPFYRALPGDGLGYVLAPAGNSEHPLQLRVQLSPAPHQVDLEATLENLSDRYYSLCWADMCLMFRFAPGFADRRGERCLLHAGNGLIRAEQTARTSWHAAWSPLVQAFRIAGSPVPYPYGVVPGLALWSVSPMPVHSGCIMMEHSDGLRHVALGWDICANVAHNPDENHHCIHSDPWFGMLPPHSSVTRRGVILFGSQGAPALLHDYLDWQERQER